MSQQDGKDVTPGIQVRKKYSVVSYGRNNESSQISSPEPLQQSTDVNLEQLRQSELDEDAKLSEEIKKSEGETNSEEETNSAGETNSEEETKSSNFLPWMKWLFNKVTDPIKKLEEENTSESWSIVNFIMILSTIAIIIAIIIISLLDWKESNSTRLASLEFDKGPFDDLVNEIPSSCKKNTTCKKALDNVENNRDVSLCHEVDTISVFHIMNLLEKLGKPGAYNASIGTNQTEDRLAQVVAELAYVKERLSLHDEVLIRYLKSALYLHHCNLVHKAFRHTADLIQRLVFNILSLFTIPLAIYWGRRHRSKRLVFGIATVGLALLNLILEAKNQRSMPAYVSKRISEAGLPVAITLFVSTFT